MSSPTPTTPSTSAAPAEARHQSTIAALTGYLGVAFIAILQLHSLPVLSDAQTAAVFCFAVAMPLIGVALLGAHGAGAARMAFSRAYVAAATFGELAVIAGVTALFWHFSIAVGITFVASGGIALAIFAASLRRQTPAP